MTRPVVEKLPFFLASASPRRRRLLKSFPWSVRVRPSHVPEPHPPFGARPERWVVKMALAKAVASARHIPRGLVLGVDTLVYRRGRFFGKPRSRRHAREILCELAGRWHRVYSGLVLLARPGKGRWSVSWCTRVKMRSLSSRELDRLSRRNHDKAGAYAAQSKAMNFVEEYRGDYDNVVGLPLRALDLLLRRARRRGYAPR